MAQAKADYMAKRGNADWWSTVWPRVQRLAGQRIVGAKSAIMRMKYSEAQINFNSPCSSVNTAAVSAQVVSSLSLTARYWNVRNTEYMGLIGSRGFLPPKPARRSEAPVEQRRHVIPGEMCIGFVTYNG